MPTKVTLRKEKISKGRMSLYLDYWPPVIDQKTEKPKRRKYLKIYILEKPKTPLEKDQNKQILMIAKRMASDEQIKFVKQDIYTDEEKKYLQKKKQGEKCFITYFESLMENQEKSYHIWDSCLIHLKKHTGGKLKFNQITTVFLNDFKNYLLSAKPIRKKSKNISTNTALLYFSKLKTAVKQAFKDELIDKDLTQIVDNISKVETHKKYLTFNELQSLFNTPYRSKKVKNVCMFSSLTGLRYSDIENLKWSDINYSENLGYHILFRQQKTSGAEYLPISEQAYCLALDVNNEANIGDNEFVFKDLKKHEFRSNEFKNWLKKAGINKNITFHSFRHTFATLQLETGTDLYTVSKMLCHKYILTTQVYAKVVDKLKVEAANKITLNLNS